MLEKIKKNKIILTLILLLFILISFITVFVCLGKTINFDEKILLKISMIRNENLTKVMILISELSSYLFITFLTIFLSIIFFKERYYIYFIINSLGVVTINTIFKFLVNRTRPEMFMIINESGKSFPSGHAMISLAFYGFLTCFCYYKFKNRILKFFSIIIFPLLILLVGFSRMYLGVHYFTDVVTGYLISGIILLIEIIYFKKKEENNGKSV